MAKRRKKQQALSWQQLLIALVLMILGIRKKKQLAAAQTADAPETAQPEPQETDPNYQSILEKNSNDD